MHLSTFHESHLPHEARANLKVWTMRMEHLLAMGRGYTNFVDNLGEQWGTSGATIIRLFNAWRKFGAVALIDKKRFGKYLNEGYQRGLPPQFIEHWKKLNRTFQRSGGAAKSYKVLMDQLNQWRRGHAEHAIPGYDYPPENQRGTLHPVGWTLGNLRRHGLEKVDAALSRQGRAAAKKYLPMVYHTRVGLKVGEVLVPDDQWWDTEVAWNNGVRSRALSFDILDLLSGFEVKYGFQKRKDDDGKSIALKEIDLFWLFLAHFTETGYREDTGTLIMTERGTAKFATDLVEGLFNASGGKITVKKGGMDNKAIKGFFFDGAAKGNPRWKPGRESTFGLLRNMAAHLIGATGRNHEESPEDWNRKNEYVEWLLRKVPEEKWHLLLLPILTENQFMEIAVNIKNAINNRTDHNLEGWDQLGFIAHMFRMPEWGDDEWVPLEAMQSEMAKLPWEKRELLNLAIKSHDTKLIHTRNMSPAEVWHAGKHELTRLSLWTYNIVIPVRLAHKRHVTDNREIHIFGMSKDHHRYDARCRNAAGYDIMLRPQDEVLVYVNPLSPDQALCCDTNGAAIGIINRIVRSTVRDEAAFLKRMGTVRQMTADIEAPIARSMEDLAAKEQAMVKHNERVVKGLPVTATEHEQAHKAKQAAKAADAIFDADHTSVAMPLQASTHADDTDIMDD